MGLFLRLNIDMPKVTDYLTPSTKNNTLVKDYRHASLLYLTSRDGLPYSLVPKTSWMYYVTYEINQDAITDASWLARDQSVVGMLVKSVELPKFTSQIEVMNQYNKKTIVQKSVTYNPVSISMHDDQSNVTHNLWLNYYRYYLADANNGAGTQLSNNAGSLASNAVSGVFGGGGLGGLAGNILGGVAGNLVSGIADKTIAGSGKGGYTPSSQYATSNLFGATDYGLNSPLMKSPFFKSITIYQLNRQLFTSFQLVNPIIANWEHDKLDQTGNKLAESRMSVQYETVFYGKGQVTEDNPRGFATLQYDTDPSPLGLGDHSNGTVTGALDLIGDVTGIGNTGKSPINLLNAAVLGAGILTGGSALGANASPTGIINTLVGGALADTSLGNTLGGLGINFGNSGASSFQGTPVSVASK